MKGFEIRFNIYAENQEEVDALRQSIVNFINLHAKEGRAVTANKLSQAINSWDSNIFVRNKIINYFK